MFVAFRSKNFVPYR